MKFLILILALMTNLAFGQGDPPPFIKGDQTTGTGNVGSTIMVPNAQSTKINSYQARIETGNNNLLVNPSFEHATYNTGWSLSGASSVAETSMVIDGKKAMAIVASGGTLSFKQSSSTNASSYNFGGVQGLGMMWINTTVQGLYLCPVKAGVSISSNFAAQCYTVKGEGVWELAKISYIFGGTSNGVELLSSGAVSGNIYVDDTFVGPADLRQDGVGAVEQELNYTLSGSTYAIENGVMDGSGLFTASGATITALEDISLALSNGIVAGSTAANGGCYAYVSSPQTSSLGDRGYHASSAASLAANASATFKMRKGEIATLAHSCSNATVNTIKVIAHATYLQKVSSYSSTNSNYGPTPYTPTISAFTGSLTNYTTSATHQRNGNLIHVEGTITFTGAPGTWSYPKVSLPSGLTPYMSSGKAVIVGSGSIYDVSGNATSALSAVVESAVGNVVYLARQDISTFSQASPYTLASGDIITFQFTIPVVEWKNSNLTVAQLSGLESCANSFECEDTYSAKVSTGPTLSDVVVPGWTTSASKGGTNNQQKTLTVPSGIYTAVPNCTCTVWNGTTAADNTCQFNATSSSTTSLVFHTTTNGVAADQAIIVNCQKAPADYVSKTAKAVASDQNDRTPGVINAVTFRFNIAASSTQNSVCSADPCTINMNKGGVVSSVDYVSAGAYDVFLTGLANSDYVCTFTTRNWLSGSDSTECVLSGAKTSSSMRVSCRASGTLMDTAFDAVCHGEKLP